MPAPHGRQTFGNSNRTQLEVYVRCEDLRRPISTFLVAYTKEPHESEWAEEYRSDPVDKSSFPNYRSWKKTDDKDTVTDALKFDYSLECVTQIRVEVFRIKTPTDLSNLSSQSFIGCAEVVLPAIHFAQSQEWSCGWAIKDLLNPTRAPGEVGRVAFLCREGNTSKETVCLDIQGKGVRSPNVWKWRCDPYIIFNRTVHTKKTLVAKAGKRQRATPREMARNDSEEPDGVDYAPKRTPLLMSEVVRRKKPAWSEIYMTVPTLCSADPTLLVEAEVRDWNNVPPHQLVGVCTFCYEDMQKAFRETKPLVLPLVRPDPPSSIPRLVCKKDHQGEDEMPMGKQPNDAIQEKTKSSRRKRFRRCLPSLKLKFDEELPFVPLYSRSCLIGQTLAPQAQKVDGQEMGSIALSLGIGRTHTMYDFIRGGLQLKLCVGIDFTRSSALAAGPSDHLAAIRAVAPIVEHYTGNKQHAVYGFGARIPPSFAAKSSDCFALSGDFFAPMVNGLEELEAAYLKALRVVRLHGPSRLQEVIRVASLWAQPHKEVNQIKQISVDMRWWICLIVTDGLIVDIHDAADAIVRASSLPISFVIIGTGDGDLSSLEKLGRQVSQLQVIQNELSRKMVHFAKFEDFKTKTPMEMTQALIADIPSIVREYFKWLEIEPWDLDKFEDEVGSSLLVPVVTAPLPNPKIERRADEASEAGISPRSSTSISPRSGEASSRATTKDPPASRPGKEPAFQMPEFLAEWRDALLQKSEGCVQVNNGGRNQLQRALREGLPDGSMQIMQDTLVNGGYGKYPIFKELLEEAANEGILAIEEEMVTRHKITMAHRQSMLGPRTELVRKCPSGHIMESLHTSRDDGWVCCGMKRFMGCRSGITGRNQTHGMDRFRCDRCNFDLCVECLRFEDLLGKAHTSDKAAISDGLRQTAKQSERADAVLSAALVGNVTSPVASDRGNSRSPSRPMSPNSQDLRQVASERGNSKNTPEPTSPISAGAAGEWTSERGNIKSEAEPAEEIEVSNKSARTLMASKISCASSASGGSLASSGSLTSPGVSRRALKSSKISCGSSASGKKVTINENIDGMALPGAVGPEPGTCTICLELLIDTELHPCGHRIACQLCAQKLGVVCPLCRQSILDVRPLTDVLE